MANIEKLHEFISYRKKLEESRRVKSTEIFFNDSGIHEEFVLKELFANAVDSSPKINTIYMYCGRLSAFRDAMQEMVEQTKNECNPGADASQEDVEEWNCFNPYSKMIDKMKVFFNEGGRMDVVVDEDISSIANEQIWRDTLSHYFYDTKQLSISRLMIDCGVEHFVVSGKAYRSELSHKDKTAICCFNDPEYSSLLYSNFSFLLNSSQPAII